MKKLNKLAQQDEDDEEEENESEESAQAKAMKAKKSLKVIAPRVRSRSGSKEFNKIPKKKLIRKASSDYDSDDEEAFKQLASGILKKKVEQ
jgi:hypothetical protein